MAHLGLLCARTEHTFESRKRAEIEAHCSGKVPYCE
jgi:hypothetical protein